MLLHLPARSMTSSRPLKHPSPLEAAGAGAAARDTFVDYFRCAKAVARFSTPVDLPTEQGYFAFGDGLAYGRRLGPRPTNRLGADLDDALRAVTSTGDELCLPFDLAEVATNLRQERYCPPAPGVLERFTASTAIQDLYYFFRPALPVGIRRHLQRVRLRGWEQIAFPRWPVDTSVDTLMRTTLGLLLRQTETKAIPFVWFWPEGAPSCAVMTHDVEGSEGQDFCSALMELDDSFGVKSAFQLVPEMYGPTTTDLVEQIRARGFEVNLHDLNHDGYLFHNRPQFLERAAQINQYTRLLDCKGFRAGAMYRNQEWFDVFEFSYDMSVPNAAHLEPQRGGCCTVMPYFVGNLLELPLTTTQDYSLFHIIGEYSPAIWRQQIDLIRSLNGFISFITHPDYLVEMRARRVYIDLLGHLQDLYARGQIWMALPGDVDRWWRNRSQMTLVPHGDTWRIEGPDSHRARIAYASLDGDRVVYTLTDESVERRQ